MKKKTLSWILALVAVAVLAGGLWFIKNGGKAKAEGTVQIQIQNLDGKTLQDKKLKFYAGDTLAGIVQQNFENVSISDGMVMTIDTLTTPEDWSTFICIYVNDEMAQVGIEEIPLNDGLKVLFADTAMSW